MLTVGHPKPSHSTRSYGPYVPYPVDGATLPHDAGLGCKAITMQVQSVRLDVKKWTSVLLQGMKVRELPPEGQGLWEGGWGGRPETAALRWGVARASCLALWETVSSTMGDRYGCALDGRVTDCD